MMATEGKSLVCGAKSASPARAEKRHRTPGTWVVLLWLIVMIPMLWGVMMTLGDVRNLFR